jgi:hypothetical protein
MEARGDRIGGGALIAASLATIVAMGHHPSSAHSGALVGIVHGAMILFLAAIAFGFARFAHQRGLARPAVLAGAIAYVFALFGHAGAATINGFVVPALAARGQPVGHDIFLFAWEANQALARLGVFANSAAILFWSADLLAGRTARLLGLAGLVAGILPVALLATGALRMDVAGAFIVYGLHAAWTALLGLQFWSGLDAKRGRRSDPS